MLLKNFLKLSVLSLFLVFSACSIFSSAGNNQANKQETDKDKVAKQNDSILNNVENNSDIEILWLIPEEHTDGFILSYGISEKKLDKKIKLFSEQVSVVPDPVYKKVYRHVLKQLPRNKIIYLQLQAFNGDDISLPSKIFTLRAN